VGRPPSRREPSTAFRAPSSRIPRVDLRFPPGPRLTGGGREALAPGFSASFQPLLVGSRGKFSGLNSTKRRYGYLGRLRPDGRHVEERCPRFVFPAARYPGRRFSTAAPAHGNVPQAAAPLSFSAHFIRESNLQPFRRFRERERRGNPPNSPRERPARPYGPLEPRSNPGRSIDGPQAAALKILRRPYCVLLPHFRVGCLPAAPLAALQTLVRPAGRRFRPACRAPLYNP